MKNLKFYLIASYLIFIFISLTGCGCQGPIQFCNFTDEEERIIGMYKPGNWWVYENTDGSRRDSVYVMEIDTSLIIDKTVNCMERHSITGLLSNEFMYRNVTNSGFLIEKNENCDRMMFFLSKSVNSLRIYRFVTIEPLEHHENFDEQIVWNDIEYDELLYYKDPYRSFEMYYKKDIGIVWWVNHELQDTFGLVKHHIQ